MRVFRNRCANTALQGLSAQPIFGGPVYFIRNIVYNGPGSGSLKFVSTPSGILTYNNTFVGEVAVPGPAANEHFRNNLILAQGAAGPVFAVGTFTNYSSSDCNGFAPNDGADASFQWSSRRSTCARITRRLPSRESSARSPNIRRRPDRTCTAGSSATTCS
jgi:hypothetical protein